MSAFLYMPPDADSALVKALVEHLRTDDGVRDVFGDPPRVFDHESHRAIFPYACLQSHEVEDESFVGAQARLHRLTFTTASRSGGIADARTLIGALSAAAERADPDLEGQMLVYCYAIYSDVVRPPDRQHFRGLLRIKLLTRAVPHVVGGIQ